MLLRKFSFFILVLLFTLSHQNKLFSQDYWWETNGPFQYGGAILCMMNTPSGDIYAGTSANLILKSTNNGESWSSFHTDLTPCFYSIVITSSGTLYAAGTYTGHIFQSVNNGESWEIIREGNGITFTLAVNDLNHVFATSRGGGVFCSTDNGDSWTAMNTGLNNLNAELIVIDQIGHIFVGTRGGGIYRSIDNGANWVEVNNGLEDLTITSLSTNSLGHIFAGTRYSGVYRSVNDGDSWVHISTGLTEELITNIFIDNTGVIYACTFNGIFQSADNGENWTLMNCVGLDVVRVMSFVKTGGFMFAGTRNGIFKSAEAGNNWTRYEGLTTKCTIWSMAKDNAGNVYAGTSVGNVFKSTNKGENWTNISRGINSPEGIYTINANSEGKLFIALCGRGIFFRSDNGETWERATEVEGLARSIVYDESSGYLFAGTTQNCYRSLDYGDTWELILPGVGVCCLFIASNGNLFAGDFGGTIYKSTNNGDDWAAFVTGGAAKIKSITENSSGDLFVAQPGSGVFRSNDNGENWIEINNGLENLNTYSVVVNISNELFTCVYGVGVYRSSNWGESWELVNEGLTDYNAQFLLNDDDDFIYVGTEFNVFRSTQPTTDIHEIDNGFPNDYMLFQNYPNPFNPTTNIKYSIPQKSFVTLKVYDILGKEIDALVHEEKQVGSYEINFNATNLSSGIYFYKIQAGDFTDTKKLILIK